MFLGTAFQTRFAHTFNINNPCTLYEQATVELVVQSSTIQYESSEKNSTQMVYHVMYNATHSMGTSGHLRYNCMQASKTSKHTEITMNWHTLVN